VAEEAVTFAVVVAVVGLVVAFRLDAAEEEVAYPYHLASYHPYPLNDRSHGKVRHERRIRQKTLVEVACGVEAAEEVGPPYPWLEVAWEEVVVSIFFA